MNKFILVIAILLSVDSLALSISCEPDQSITTKEDLEKAYEEAEFAFVANVEIEYLDQDPLFRWKYTLIEPVLKGAVPHNGTFVPSKESCAFPDVTEDGAYLVFLKEMLEPISNRNSVLVVYGQNQVMEEWVVEWAHEKARNKELNLIP